MIHRGHEGTEKTQKPVRLIRGRGRRGGLREVVAGWLPAQRVLSDDGYTLASGDSQARRD